MTSNELESEILKLDPTARADLAAKLLRSLEELSNAENESLWANEAQRRHDELVAGRAGERPAVDVLRDARGYEYSQSYIS